MTKDLDLHVKQTVAITHITEPYYSLCFVFFPTLAVTHMAAWNSVYNPGLLHLGTPGRATLDPDQRCQIFISHRHHALWVCHKAASELQQKHFPTDTWQRFTLKCSEVQHFALHTFLRAVYAPSVKHQHINTQKKV